MKQSTKVSLAVVVVICIFLLINGAIVLYACLVWPQENAGSPLFITGVVTFLISFSLPFILVGTFLLYSLCQQECSPRNSTQLDLLPANLFRPASSGSNNSIAGMSQKDNCPNTLLEVVRPDENGRGGEVSSKYFTPFNHREIYESHIYLTPKNHRAMRSSFDLGQEEATVGKQEKEKEEKKKEEKEEKEEKELQELHFSRSISPSPLPPARFIRMAGKELILGPPWEEGNMDRD